MSGGQTQTMQTMRRHGVHSGSRNRTLSAACTRVSDAMARRSSFAEPVPIHGNGDPAVVLGGFGFTKRALRRHEELYEGVGFEVMPVLSGIRDLITPEVARERSGPQRGRA